MRLQSAQIIANPSLRARTAGDDIDPVELYAAAIDTSDYVTRLAPVICGLIGDAGDLLDIGAGGGQLGAGLRFDSWTAIEPNPNMCARLARFPQPPLIVTAGWEKAPMPAGAFDTVLAATMPATMDAAEKFLMRCQEWSRRRVVWVVPAHRGPRGLIYAGCLPREWHGEDETPGLEIVLRRLEPSSRPHEIVFVDWTFTAVVADIAATAQFLARRLRWPPSDARRAALREQLTQKAGPVGTGYRLEIPRKSAVLVWGRQCVSAQELQPH